jgi:hypothetical protein
VYKQPSHHVCNSGQQPEDSFFTTVDPGKLEDERLLAYTELAGDVGGSGFEHQRCSGENQTVDLVIREPQNLVASVSCDGDIVHGFGSV